MCIINRNLIPLFLWVCFELGFESFAITSFFPVYCGSGHYCLCSGSRRVASLQRTVSSGKEKLHWLFTTCLFLCVRNSDLCYFYDFHYFDNSTVSIIPVFDGAVELHRWERSIFQVWPNNIFDCVDWNRRDLNGEYDFLIFLGGSSEEKSRNE